MDKVKFDYTRWFKLLLASVIVSVLLVRLVAEVRPASAETVPVLTIKLRDSHGVNLAGVLCEVLSYDWGRPQGQAYGVIARGETDQNGTLAFDVSVWPRTGYRFKFTKTERTVPVDTYFENDEYNQYRGFPAATVGGRTEVLFFYISGEGLAFNDLSGGNGAPFAEKNPVAGLERPRVTIISGDAYLATAIAATAQAEARGTPSPTRPLPPVAFKTVQPALATTSAVVLPTSTPQAAQNSIFNPLPTATPRVEPPASSSGEKTEPSADPAHIVQSLILALIGVASFVVFWRYRFAIYPWLGIQANPKVKVRKLKNRRNQKPNKSFWQKLRANRKKPSSKAVAVREETDETL